MCKTESTIFKNYARGQDDNFESFDIVKELVQFLKAFEGLIDSGSTFWQFLLVILIDGSLELALQLFAALNEFIINSSENQVWEKWRDN